MDNGPEQRAAAVSHGDVLIFLIRLVGHGKKLNLNWNGSRRVLLVLRWWESLRLVAELLNHLHVHENINTFHHQLSWFNPWNLPEFTRRPPLPARRDYEQTLSDPERGVQLHQNTLTRNGSGLITPSWQLRRSMSCFFRQLKHFWNYIWKDGVIVSRLCPLMNSNVKVSQRHGIRTHQNSSELRIIQSKSNCRTLSEVMALRALIIYWTQRDRQRDRQSCVSSSRRTRFCFTCVTQSLTREQLVQ